MRSDSGRRTGEAPLRCLATTLVFAALLQAMGAVGPVAAGAGESAATAPITALAVKLVNHAQALGGDLPRFQQCLDSGRYATNVRADLADGQKAGVSGTPTFFLGLTEPNGSTVKAVRKLVGAQPYGAFKEPVDSILAPQKK